MTAEITPEALRALLAEADLPVPESLLPGLARLLAEYLAALRAIEAPEADPGAWPPPAFNFDPAWE